MFDSAESAMWYESWPPRWRDALRLPRWSDDHPPRRIPMRPTYNARLQLRLHRIVRRIRKNIKKRDDAFYEKRARKKFIAKWFKTILDNDL